MQMAINDGLTGKLIKATSAGAVASALVLGFSIPAYADDVFSDPVILQIQSAAAQQLVSSNADEIASPNAGIDPVKKAAEKPANVEPQNNAATVAQPAAPKPAPAANNSGNGRGASAVSAPASVSGGSLVDAARSQIGVGQDCTDLVQNSLAAIGKTTRRDQGGYDEGTMTFGKYGTVVPASEARYGDIVARGSHVFIYTGDGVHHSGIHGGWNGVTTAYVAGSISDPANYAVVIRVQ